jgi:DNA-binding CsgD family transcriptional regulator
MRSLRGHRFANLSPRERVVVIRVTRGLLLKEIASELDISVYTVATHLARARRKLSQGSRWKLSVCVCGTLPSFRELLRPRTLTGLGPQDLQLGQLLLAGLSNAEIARRRGTNARQVANHVARLLRKIGARGRTALISRAARVAKSGLTPGQ